MKKGDIVDMMSVIEEDEDGENARSEQSEKALVPQKRALMEVDRTMGEPDDFNNRSGTFTDFKSVDALAQRDET